MPNNAAVIQGSFPNGLSRVAPAPAAAQPLAAHSTPAWVQARVGAPGAPRPVQRQAAPTAAAHPNAVQLQQHAVELAPAGGQPLPPQVRQKMEAIFRTDFRDVRIHVGPQASTLGATSFTHGSHIHFAPGQYDPDTAHGQQILGRELAHVVQQRAGRVRNPFGSGVALVHDRSLEAEAERMATRASAVQPKSARPRTVQMLKRIHDMLKHPWKIVAPQTVLLRYAAYLADVAKQHNVMPAYYEMAELYESMTNNPPLTSLKISEIRKQMNEAAALISGYENTGFVSNNNNNNDIFKIEENEKVAKFVSLDVDVQNKLYQMTVTQTNKIRMKSGEDPFEEYSNGTSVSDAVLEAIEGLDLTGSISFKYSRHDFQPSSKETVNLQVQLGGAKTYRSNKGDTSSTLVVISTTLFEQMYKSDKARLKQVLQAAHKLSFNKIARVDLQ